MITIYKWLLIIFIGTAILSLSTSLLQNTSGLLNFLGYEDKVYVLFTLILTLPLVPIMFIIMISHFYSTNVDIILWVTWEIIWGIILYYEYKNRDLWSQTWQQIIHLILALSALAPFVFWNLFITPQTPGLPAMYYMPLDPFYTVQVAWVFPLWYMIWIYGWLIEIPQNLVKKRKITLNAFIWLLLFLVFNLYVIFYLSEYIWWTAAYAFY